jgi:hypothetical protein
MERTDMIELLRDKDHLDLSCNVHNYTKVGACAGISVMHTTQSVGVTWTFALIGLILAILAGVAGGYMYLRKPST